nr:MAG TPA: hypothetical protein [Caudoviricetes sp.]
MFLKIFLFFLRVKFVLRTPNYLQYKQYHKKR